MSPKASSDFGLYKEKQKDNNIKTVKFILVAVVAILFFFVILYALVVYIISGGSDGENSFQASREKPTAKAEKLVLAHSVKREIFQSAPPKPFGVTYQGQPPSQFTPSTEKTPKAYPHQSSFRHRYYPNNIQDVIGYANILNRPAATNSVKYTNHKQSSTEYISQNKRPTKNSTAFDSDPFSRYKPKDPGDINLLATASFRFAPPPWSNLRAQFSRSQQYQENTKRHEVFNVRPKPLSVTLNIYPNKENQRFNEQRYGLKQFISKRIENIPSRVRFPEDNKSKKMVIHLNLYPDDISEDESKVRGNIITTTASSPPLKF